MEPETETKTDAEKKKQSQWGKPILIVCYFYIQQKPNKPTQQTHSIPNSDFNDA